MTVRQLLDVMDNDEMIAWMAYERIEPFGEERADLRAGINTATLININTKRGSKTVKPSDVIPRFDKRYLPHSADDEARAMFLSKFGGEVQ
jgi:hypothetical protein